jgi:thiamine kinase-like enzyme
MVVLHSDMNLFPFIGTEHPFYAQIRRLNTDLIATRLYQEMRQRFDVGEEKRIRISMKARPSSNSALSLKGFYLSLQFKKRLGSSRFQASTFFCSAKTGSIESFEFPQDPCLTTLATYFDDSHFRNNGKKASLDREVLRYYPRRRLTFRTTTSDENAPVIGKFVQTSNLKDTYKKLIRIHQAVSRSPAAFSVAAPVKIDVNNSLFLQEARPGKALADLIKKENSSDLLYALGLIHRDLHRLDVSDLPELDFGAFLQNLALCIEWISFFQPQERSFFENVRDLLVKHVPRIDPSAFRFCHGDFSCLQVVKDHESYSVIDFDDCMLGDPYLEIARLIAFLKYDIPLFSNWFFEPKQTETGLLEEAYGAYLNGYQEKGPQPFNQKRLLWYRICFEIHYLARLFKRDLFHPVAFNRTIKIIQELSERFGKEKGEDY